MDTAKSVQDRYRATAEEIESRRDLTEEAKRVATARVYVEGRDRLAELKTAALEELKNTRFQLERQIFGTLNSSDAPTAISRRDAQDRAATIKTPEAAAGEMRRAARGGDDILEQAIAARALEMSMSRKEGEGWWGLVQEYVSTRPAAAAALAELEQLPNPASPSYRMRLQMDYSLGAVGALTMVRRQDIEGLARNTMQTPDYDAGDPFGQQRAARR